MAKGKKTGGREKGAPNRLTKEMRIVLKNIIGDELECLQLNISQLNPNDRLSILLKLLPYVMPKVKDIESDQGERWDFDF